jgi:hypothetical protein
MQCPQCGAETPDQEWNCVSCRMNVYWASQHYADLAGVRRRQGLPSHPDTPPFLLTAHASAMDERAERGGKVEHKVRQIARRVMREQTRDRSASPASGQADPSAAAEPGWKPPEIASPYVADTRARHPEEAT